MPTREEFHRTIEYLSAFKNGRAMARDYARSVFEHAIAAGRSRDGSTAPERGREG